MSSHRPIQFSLRTLILVVTLAAAMLWAASWLGGPNVLALSLIVLIPSAAVAGVCGWLFLENDVVHFGVIGAAVGFLFGFLGAGYDQSVLGGVLLGALVGDVLRDGRREPLFAGQWRRRRQWHLICRSDRASLARVALAVACLAAFCPLAGFWVAHALSPAGINLNALAGDFWEFCVREVQLRQSVREGAYFRQQLLMPFVVNWHVLGMLGLCLVLCVRLRRREAEPPVVDLNLAHVSTAFALAILLFSLQVSQGFYYVLTYGGDIGNPKRFFFEMGFWFGWESAPVIVAAPLVALALGPYRGRFLRSHVWLPAVAAIGLLNLILLLVLIGCTLGPLR